MSVLLGLRIALILPLIAANTLLHAVPVLGLGLVKAALPFAAVRRACTSPTSRASSISSG